MKRKINVPGVQLEVKSFLNDVARNRILAVRHADQVVIFFPPYGQSPPAAWAMTDEQAAGFIKEVKEAQTAMSDYLKLAKLEKEFDKPDGD